MNVGALCDDAAGHLDEDINSLLMCDAGNGDHKEAAAFAEGGCAKLGRAGRVDRGHRLQAEADDPDFRLGHAADCVQLLAAAPGDGDDQVGREFGDPGELADPLGLGPVVGDGDWHLHAEAGQARHEGRGRFVGMDQVYRVMLQPAAKGDHTADQGDDAGRDATAEVGNVLCPQRQEAGFELAIAPRALGACEVNGVPALAQPLAELPWRGA